MLIEAGWDAAKLLSGLTVKGTLAFDAGTLRGDNFGAMVTISYKGNIALTR
jgi:hypothetical protein